MKPRNPAKFDRCVKAVKKRGSAVDPYAVCTAAGTRNPLALSSLASLPGVSSLGKKAQRFAKTGKLNPRNPEVAAIQGYEMFHGRAPQETVTVEYDLHYHAHLWAIGDLVKLAVENDNGRKVDLSRFEDRQGNVCLLCGNEPIEIDGKPVATQLYLRGGDQRVSLDDFDIGEPYHDVEYLGEVIKIWYYTTKDHLGDQGGEATYHHKTGEERRYRDKEFGVVRGRKVPRPRLVYDVLNEQLQFAGGEYTIEVEGIRN